MIFKPNGLAIALCALLLTTAAAAAACPANLAADLDRAIASKSPEAVRSAMDAIANNFACNDQLDEFRGKMIDFEIDLAINPSIPAATREHALEDATENIAIGGTWREAKKLGDYYESVKDDAQALAWYEKGISLLGRVPSTGATDKELVELSRRVGAAKSLANNDGEGKRDISFQASRVSMDGRLEGLYSPVLRGVEVGKVPVPVNFFTGETRFTPAGAAALAELAEAIKEQEVHEFKLVGHADPRGNAQFNLDLSKRRAQAVRDELVNRGIQARITIEGKGDTEPFDVSVLGRPVSQDEAWQLDRRVEWITAGGAK